jgi:hypothetical protein
VKDMYEMIYDSRENNESQFISYMQSLMGNMLVCVYKDGRLCNVSRYFKDVYNALQKASEYVVVTRNGNNVLINDYIIMRTTELGKDILVSWYKGHTYYEYNMLGSFKIDSPLVRTIY